MFSRRNMRPAQLERRLGWRKGSMHGSSGRRQPECYPLHRGAVDSFELAGPLACCLSRPKKSAECKSNSGAGTGRSARTASLAVSSARAFRRVPVPSTHFGRRQAGPLAHRLRMAAIAFSLRGAFSGSGTVWSPRRGFIMPDTSSKHDQTLGVELMRRYCDPRGDFAWDSADRVRVHRWHRRCGPTSAHSTALLDVRFDDVFVSSSALVCLTTADRAGEACTAV